MSTTHRHVFAGRRMSPGLALLATVLFFFVQRPVRCAEIVVTVTGIVDGGTGDFLRIFGPKRNLDGTPFTAVLTFDDSKGKPLSPYHCDGSATGAEGSGTDSPGTGILTIAGKSYAFGTHKDSHSAAWRSITSPCSRSQITFQVDDNVDRFNTILRVNLHTEDTRNSLTQNPDWRASLSSTAMQSDLESGFAIQGPGQSGDGGIFVVKSITISGPIKATLTGGR
jgi:hypothetical protein